MPAPEIIRNLVARFEENRDAYRSGNYNETQLRLEFLDPFFQALGWDMYNQKGFSPEYREVVHEDSIEIEGGSKAPDYSFRIGKERKFFVEAKKPAVNIEYDIHPAYQLRRYAWNVHLPLSILTDFEEFAVYDCRDRPNPTDKASTDRTIFLTYKEYIEKWDKISGIFSPEAIQKGSFEKYAIENKGKKGTTEVDDAFLEDIENWRKMLALNIALRNPQVADDRELNFAVQMTIDRIIFLRICEDRGIEPEEQLLNATKKPEIYAELMRLFQSADRKYNSGLFHFKSEGKGDSGVDAFTPTLTIDDKTLKEIIKSIYYPCPYIFKEIPVEILGQVYEQFLGRVIRLTPGHQAKVEEKPEVRKAGGVYYTPAYIVNYIVQNTVGKLLEGKTPTTATSLKIVDPACGSGSFLLGAFQYLIDWHEKWYLDNGAEKWAKGKNPALVATSGGGWKLTTSEKKKILLNNIHGVDIDAQAVEVTKLSLLLKVLEEESGQMSLGLERVLPDLGKNIQCGNSLIGDDFFEGQLVVDEEERRKVNPFDWEAAFPEVFKQGGFDAVIGNPPWGAEFSSNEKEYFRIQFSDFHVRTPESFNYFIGKMSKISGNTGYVGVIVPSSFLNQQEFLKTRKYLVENTVIYRVCNLGDGIFEKVTAPSCILIFNKPDAQEESYFFDLRQINRKDLPISLQNKNLGVNASGIGLDSDSYILQLHRSNKIIQKCNQFPKMREIVEEVATGVSSGLDSAFIYKEEDARRLNLEDALLRKLVIGGEINRYQIKPISGKLIIYSTRDINITDYPNCLSVLSKYREKLTKRVETASGLIPWYSLYRPRRKKLFERPKILIRQTADRVLASYDTEGWFCLKSGLIIQLPNDSNLSYEYLLGLINSNLFKFLYDDLVGEQARVFPEVKPIQLFKLPIRAIDFSDAADVNSHDSMVSLVERMLELHKRTPHTPQEKESLQREIASTDRQIDKLVYELYGLTEEEIKIVDSVK